MFIGRSRGPFDDPFEDIIVSGDADELSVGEVLFPPVEVGERPLSTAPYDSAEVMLDQGTVVRKKGKERKKRKEERKKGKKRRRREPKKGTRKKKEVTKRAVVLYFLYRSKIVCS